MTWQILDLINGTQNFRLQKRYTAVLENLQRNNLWSTDKILVAHTPAPQVFIDVQVPDI